MDVIAMHAERQPERAAIIEGERRVTWREYRDLRNRLGHSIVALGIEPGDHVAIYSLNCLEVLLASAAARAAGAIPVPLNHRLAAEEVAYILDDSEASAVFVGDGFLNVAEQVRGQAKAVRAWIVIGRDRRDWAHRLDELIAAGRPEPVSLPGGEVFGASMVYTAGTTGKPKGARRRASSPAEVLKRLRDLDVADPAHVHLVAGPLYHSAPGGFALYAHLVGSTVVVMPRFDPEAALAAIERHRCSSTFMAPTLLKRIVDLPAAVRARYDVSSMRAIVMAAAPCPMRVKEAVLACFGPVLYEFYGSTELGINTVLAPGDVLRKPGSCGRAPEGVELAILDDDGRPVPPGEPGELFVRRNPSVFDEYWKKPEATRNTARGEWLSVGDVAYMDAEGFVYICDRKRDMVISGGVNIYPAEVEDALHRHPKVQDAAVFGVPDDEWGERVHAAVELRPGETMSAEEVRAFCRQHLADYKVPREVSFHERLPRDSAGKLVKRVLREPHWAGRVIRV
jgi:fatty-acyl-CoA synthase/long-chain acyl-CoA synthetase